MTAAVTQGVTQGATRPAPATNPYLGILGVFLGAGVATLNARLVSVGLPDLRGALGLSFFLLGMYAFKSAQAIRFSPYSWFVKFAPIYLPLEFGAHPWAIA